MLALDSKEIRSFKDAWNSKCDDAFTKLKEALVSAPVLRHTHFNRPFVIETDASEFALGAVLLQSEEANPNIFHPEANKMSLLR